MEKAGCQYHEGLFVVLVIHGSGDVVLRCHKRPLGWLSKSLTSTAGMKYHGKLLMSKAIREWIIRSIPQSNLLILVKSNSKPWSSLLVAGGKGAAVASKTPKHLGKGDANPLLGPKGGDHLCARVCASSAFTTIF